MFCALTGTAASVEPPPSHTPTQTRASIAALESIPIAAFVAGSPEEALATRIRDDIVTLKQLVAKAALLHHRQEIVSLKRSWLTSITINNPNTLVKMLRREDLHPQLHNLDLCYHDTENELQECANGINSVINSFIQHEMMCQHSTQVNKSVAAELQQAGVFGVATKKLLVSDILQEVYSRIRVSVLGNMDGVSPSNVNSWQNLVNTFSQTRKRQEEVYSSTHKLFSGAATAEPVTATVSTVSSQVSLSQTSFNIDSPARLLNHGNPPDLLLGDKIDANSDSEGRKRKRHTQESESPVFASKLKAVLKPILALSEELDPNYSIFSSLSRIQTTPLKDLIQENYRRYPNDLKQGTPDEGGKFQNSIGKHSESVLVEETEEPDKRRRISGESSRTSQSSRTTAGEFKEGLIGGSQPISTEDEFHEYGSSAFSVVEYEGVIVDELALSAESDEATGSLIAQATLKRQ